MGLRREWKKIRDVLFAACLNTLSIMTLYGGDKERMRENEGWIGKAKVEGEQERMSKRNERKTRCQNEEVGRRWCQKKKLLGRRREIYSIWTIY